MYRWIRITFISIIVLVLLFIIIGQIDRQVYSHRLKRIDRIEDVIEDGKVPEVRHYKFLSRTINHNRSEIALKALAALYHIDNKEAEAELMSALENDNYYIRKYAVFYLGDMGAEQAADQLIEQLDDSNHRIRTEAALALGKLGITSSVPYLNEQLSDFYDDVILASTMALGEFADESSIVPLVGNICHPNASIRKQSVDALKEIQSEKTCRLILKRIDHTDNMNDREYYVTALSELNDPDYILFMSQELRIAYKLSERGQKGLDYSFAILDYLGKQIDTTAARSLLETFNYDDSLADHSTELILSNYNSIYSYVLKESLEKDIFLNNANVRIIYILGAAKDSSVVPFLVGMYEATKIYSIKNAVAKALGTIGDHRATDVLVNSLINDRCELRRYAAQSLARIKDKKAISPLVATLACPYSMYYAAMALDSLDWAPVSEYEKIHYYIASGQHGKLIDMNNSAISIMRNDLEEGYVTKFDSIYVQAYKLVFPKDEFIRYFVKYADLRVVEEYDRSTDVLIGEAIEKWRIRQSFYQTKYQFR